MIDFSKNLNLLFTLYKDSEWRPVENISKYNNIYTQIKKYLDSNKKSTLCEVKNFQIEDSDFILNIFETQKHRGCTVCFVKQTTKTTKNIRILAYGISHPENALDYGIGKILLDIKPSDIKFLNFFEDYAFLL